MSLRSLSVWRRKPLMLEPAVGNSLRTVPKFAPMPVGDVVVSALVFEGGYWYLALAEVFEARTGRRLVTGFYPMSNDSGCEHDELDVSASARRVIRGRTALGRVRFAMEGDPSYPDASFAAAVSVFGQFVRRLPPDARANVELAIPDAAREVELMARAQRDRERQIASAWSALAGAYEQRKRGHVWFSRGPESDGRVGDDVLATRSSVDGVLMVFFQGAGGTSGILFEGQEVEEILSRHPRLREAIELLRDLDRDGDRGAKHVTWFEVDSTDSVAEGHWDDDGHSVCVSFPDGERVTFIDREGALLYGLGRLGPGMGSSNRGLQ